MTVLNRADFRALSLLRRGALVRLNGQWRFGGTEVGDTVVARLIAAGRASHLFPDAVGECVIMRIR